MIRMIAAVSKNGVIGQENKIPWECPEDMKFFRKMTANSTVIMGRKTYESIGRPLPKRRNVVITRSTAAIEGVELASSFRDAIDMTSTPIPAVAVMDKDGNYVPPEDLDNIWLIGGHSIYLEGLSLAHEIYLTAIPETITGDNLTFFPWIDPSKFQVAELIRLGDTNLKVAKYLPFHVPVN
jgi:dihydrofolate reductase